MWWSCQISEFLLEYVSCRSQIKMEKLTPVVLQNTSRRSAGSSRLLFHSDIDASLFFFRNPITGCTNFWRDFPFSWIFLRFVFYHVYLMPSLKHIDFWEFVRSYWYCKQSNYAHNLFITYIWGRFLRNMFLTS